MTEAGKESELVLGRPVKFWVLALIGTAVAFVGVLACGLAFGVGAFSAARFLTTDVTASEAALSAVADVSEPAAFETDAAAADEPRPVEAEEAVIGIHKQSAFPPKIGNPATDFTLENLEGNLVSLSDFKGQPVIINFWATWCGPCEAEMPEINRAYLKHKEEGLVVLAVDLQEHPDTVRSFVNYYELDFTILLDRDGAVGQQYGARALPTTFFIDSSGTIVHSYFGQMDEKAIEIGLRKILP